MANSIEIGQIYRSKADKNYVIQVIDIINYDFFKQIVIEVKVLSGKPKKYPQNLEVTEYRHCSYYPNTIKYNYELLKETSWNLLYGKD